MFLVAEDLHRPRDDAVESSVNVVGFLRRYHGRTHPIIPVDCDQNPRLRRALSSLRLLAVLATLRRWRHREPQKTQVIWPDGEQRVPEPCRRSGRKPNQAEENLVGYQPDLAWKSYGLTFQQVQKYEKGINRVSSSRLFDLTRILDVPISYFFDDMSRTVQDQSPSNLIAQRKLPTLDQEVEPMAKWLQVRRPSY